MISSRKQQAFKQRGKAERSEAETRDETLQQADDSRLDVLADDAPPQASSMVDTESVMQQLNDINRCAAQMMEPLHIATTKEQLSWSPANV
jgi:hypothetical protein